MRAVHRGGIGGGLSGSIANEPRQRGGKWAGFIGWRRFGVEGGTRAARERRQRQRELLGHGLADIDRIANEGAIFTDYYGQQSCTAGRAAFITGDSWRKNPTPAVRVGRLR